MRRPARDTAGRLQAGGASKPPLHVIVPAGIDDPARPSGGNVYDRRLITGLRALGWAVREHAVPAAGLTHLLARLPDDTLVLLDALLTQPSGGFSPPGRGFSPPSGDLSPSSGDLSRLRAVVLLHMPFAEAFPEVDEHERRVLAAARAVVTTSRWSREWVVEHHGLPADRVHVAEPGVAPAPLASGSGTGSHLVCLAAVTPAKGHDTLLAALTRLADLDWRCTCVGALDLDPEYVGRLRAEIERAGLADRVGLTGALTGPALDAALDAADLLVSASRRESYGMAVTEALARGIPVVATDVGGHPEAMGRTPDGERPGVLLPPDDPSALAGALRRWVLEPDHRADLRRRATVRRTDLGSWEETARRIEAVLDSVLDPVPGSLPDPVNHERPSSVSPSTTT